MLELESSISQKYKELFDFTPIKVAAARGLQSVGSIIVSAYADDLIHDKEFILFNGDNISWHVYPYWKFSCFNLDDWDNMQCKC